MKNIANGELGMANGNEIATVDCGKCSCCKCPAETCQCKPGACKCCECRPGCGC